MKKLSILLLAALSSLCTTGCSLQDVFNGGGKDDPGKKEEEVKVEAVVLDYYETEMLVGDHYQLQPVVLPEKANQNVFFETDDIDNKIITVDERGGINAVGPGEACVWIFSQADKTKYTQFDVSVDEVIVNYTVTFNSNGGTGIMNPRETSGSSFLVPDCSFERDNYHFLNWTYELHGEVETCYPEDILVGIDSDITLTANWESDVTVDYAVTFISNGGTGTMSAATTNGSTYLTPACSFKKENYTFDKWALGSVSGTKYAAGATIYNISSDIVLYATWKENSYTVTFNANGGTGTMTSKTTNGSTYVTPGCSFSKSGNAFDGWALGSASGTKYAVGATITNIHEDITLYATWVEQSDPYYAACEGLSGSALQSKLLQINKPKSPSYDWGRYEDADEALDDPSSILCVYTRHNIKKSNHVGGSYSWDSWNREHVWTQTEFPNSKTDNHNIFACEGQINGYRSNYIFNEGGDIVVVHGHTTECRLVKNTSFEPCDDAKGEIARSVMYGTVMYSYTMTQEIKSIYLALKWHIEHPITERDIRRNEVVYGNQGNRNPFVDHPEYACRIWGNTDANTRSICGM